MIDIELAISLEYRGYAQSVEEIYDETLKSGSEVLNFLRTKGFSADSVTIEPLAEFPRGAKKFVAKLMMAFSLAAAGEAGKEAGKDLEKAAAAEVTELTKAAANEIRNFFDEKFHYDAQVNVEIPPSPSRSSGP